MNDGQNDKNRGDDDPMASIGEPFDNLGYIGQIPESVAQLNKEYAVIMGQKPRILTWERSAVHRSGKIPLLLEPKAFDLLLANRQQQIGYDEKKKPITVALSLYWKQSPHRKTYSGLRFEPNGPEEIPHGEPGKPPYRNLWQGFTVGPAKGDWSLMREHIRVVLANGSQDRFDTIMKYMAWNIQHPGEQAQKAMVFMGPKGTGKGTFCNEYISLFGVHGWTFSSADALTGKYNEFLNWTAMVLCDEAEFLGQSKPRGKLQALITERTGVTEGKFQAIQQGQNHLSVIMSTEKGKWAIPAGEDERRYIVYEVSEAHMQDNEYFGKIHAQMNAGGRAAMLYDFLNMDLGDFHPRDLESKSEELSAQIRRGMSAVKAFFLECAKEGQLPIDKGWMNFMPEKSSYLPGSVAVPQAMLWAAIRTFGEDNGFQKLRYADLEGEAAELGIVVPKHRPKQRFDNSLSDGSVRVRQVPSLSSIRAWFDKKKYIHGSWVEAGDEAEGSNWTSSPEPVDNGVVRD